MKSPLVKIAFTAASVFTMVACNNSGSCKYSTPDGFDVCEDFLGAEYDPSVGQNTCDNNDGTWSSDNCSKAGAIGTCLVSINGVGSAQDVTYTYYAQSGAAGPITTLAAQTTCGVAGGSFTAAQ